MPYSVPLLWILCSPQRSCLEADTGHAPSGGDGLLSQSDSHRQVSPVARRPHISTHLQLEHRGIFGIPERQASRIDSENATLVYSAIDILLAFAILYGKMGH